MSKRADCMIPIARIGILAIQLNKPIAWWSFLIVFPQTPYEIHYQSLSGSASRYLEMFHFALSLPMRFGPSYPCLSP